LFLSLGLNTEKESTYWLESFQKFLLNLRMFTSLLEETAKEWVIYNNLLKNIICMEELNFLEVCPMKR
jgi:hypothetical protein